MSHGHVTDLVYRRTEVELWERWKQGQGISSISRALERRTKDGVPRIVSGHGGIAPSAKRRASLALGVGSARRSLAGLLWTSTCVQLREALEDLHR